MIIAAVVGVQFVEVDVATFAGINISLQKLVLVSILPLGLLLLGKFAFPGRLIVIGNLFLLSLSLSWIAGVAESAPGSYLFAAVLNILGAAVLFTALSDSRGNLTFFSHAWIFFGSVSAAITNLQFIRFLPEYQFGYRAEGEPVTREEVLGFVRATGLKYDPNFQALVLVISLVFVCFITRPLARRTLTLLITAGIFCTLSRMGMLLALLVIIGSASASLYQPGHSGAATFVRKTLVQGALASTVGIASFWLLPIRLQEYVSNRISDSLVGILVFIQGDGRVGGPLTSGQSRGLVLRGALDVARENWLFGVGPGRMEELLYQSGSFRNVAHNTYVELICVGGVVVGLATILVIVWSVLHALRRPSGVPASSSELIAARLSAIAFAVGCLFLSMLTISILWVLLAFWLAIGQTNRSQNSNSAYAAADTVRGRPSYR